MISKNKFLIWKNEGKAIFATFPGLMKSGVRVTAFTMRSVAKQIWVIEIDSNDKFPNKKFMQHLFARTLVT